MASQKDNNDGPNDDRAAWRKVTAQTKPLDPKKRTRREGAVKNPKNKSMTNKGETTPPHVAPQVNTQAARSPRTAFLPRPDIEPKARRRLGRGTLEIEGRLDMHGMTADKARAALIRFVAQSHELQKTWVLVITGKGKHGEGILRTHLPQWLSAPPLSAYVVEYAQAAAQHGGAGAFYLRLRRHTRRTKSK